MSKKKKTKSPPVKKPSRLQKKISKPSADKQLWTEWRKTFDSISDWVSVIDAQSNRILFSNKTSKKILGIPAKKIIGKRCCEIVHGSKTPMPECPVKKMLKTHKRESMELLLPAKNQWLMITADLIKDNGKITRFVHIVRDITKQKKIEHDLVESKRFLNSIFTSIPDGISILNEKMEIVGVNTAMEKWYSHAMPLVGKKCYQAYHGRTKVCDICPSRQTLRTGKPAYEVVPKTGKQKKILGWHDLYSFPWYDSKTGNLNGVIEYVRDVTERKRAEEALRGSEEKFRALFESAKDGILQISSNGDVVALNESFASMHGWTVEEMLKMNLKDLDAPESAALAPARLQRLFAGESMVFEVEHYCKNGQTIPIEVSANLVTIRGEKYIFGFHRDITERKNAEDELQKSAKRLHVILESTNDGILAVNTVGKTIMTNKRFADLWRIPQTLIDSGDDKAMLDFVLEQLIDPDGFIKRVNALYNTAEIANDTILFKDGRTFERYSTPMLHAGAVIGRLWSFRDITERRQTEDVLRESEDKFRNIFNNTYDGIIIVSQTDRKFIEVNQTICTMLGYTREELIGLGIEDIHPRESLQNVSAEFEAQMQGKKKIVEALPVLRKDGSVFYADISAAMLKLHGKPCGIGIFRDITERKKTEEALRASEEKFKALADQSISGIYLIQDGKFVYVNPRFAEILGFQQKEMIGLTALNMVAEKDRSAAGENFRKRLSGEVHSIHYTACGLKKDGSEVELEVHGSSMMYQGRPAIMGMMLDITERKKAENDLHVLLSRQKALLEAIPDIIMEVNSDKIYTWANQAGIEFFGDDVIGKEADYYFEGVQDTYSSVQPLFNGKENVIYIESLQRRKDSQKRLLAWWCKVMKDTSGNVIGALSSARDITEQRKAEEALMQAKNEIEEWSRELEDRVNEKTAEVTKSREQLIQSEKLSAMGRLSAGLAHELNSPLAGLLPLIDKYKNREKEGTNEFKEMTLMLKACEHMARIVRDFSAFSRRPSEERARLNINDVIESTLSFTVDSLEKKEIKTARQYGEALPDIMGNRTEIQQVLINLLTNARDAMPDGGQIIIKTLVSADKENIILEFIDTGTGIEKENLDKIFDPFFTTKSIAEGTGLGLTVSYGIIKNHGGDISVESEFGKGARFIISLPAVK